MTKWVGLGIVMIALAASTSFGGTIAWAYASDLGGSYTAGWLVEIIEDVNQDGISIGGGLGSGMIMYRNPGDLSRAHLDGDDTWVTANITTTLQSGKTGTGWGTTFNAPGSSLATSDNIYTVIYNGATFESATQYRVVDASPFALPSTDIDADYAPGSVNGAWAPIVAVPEPGSMVLFALGIVTLAVRRKRR